MIIDLYQSVTGPIPECLPDPYGQFILWSSLKQYTIWRTTLLFENSRRNIDFIGADISVRCLHLQRRKIDVEFFL